MRPKSWAFSTLILGFLTKNEHIQARNLLKPGVFYDFLFFEDVVGLKECMEHEILVLVLIFGHKMSPKCPKNTQKLSNLGQFMDFSHHLCSTAYCSWIIEVMYIVPHIFGKLNIMGNSRAYNKHSKLIQHQSFELKLNIFYQILASKFQFFANISEILVQTNFKLPVIRCILT